MIVDPGFATRIAPEIAELYIGRRVLVAGGGGFLGSNCIDALLCLGADVSVMCRPDSEVDVRCRHIFYGDARDPELLRRAVEGNDLVFDFLGGTAAVASNQDPLASLDGELRAHLSLFDACACSQSRPVLMFCSSRLVYGKPDYLPVDENHPLRPQSFYAINKIAAEDYLQLFKQTKGLKFCIIRLSNPYGPNQSKQQKGYGIINQFIRAAANHHDIVLFGDGRQERDYVHVSDVMIAFLSCALTEACHHNIFNFGGSTVISLGDVAMLISKLAGGTPVRCEPWPLNYSLVETGNYATDLSKINSTIKLPPQIDQIAGFDAILRAYRIPLNRTINHRSSPPIGLAI